MRYFSVLLALLVAFSFAGCKKAEFDSQGAIVKAEESLKAVPAKDAAAIAEKRFIEKKEGVKGLLESSITKSDNEYCFHIGVNIAELELFYSLLEQPDSVNLFRDSMNFFIEVMKRKVIYEGDIGDFKAAMEKIANMQTLSADYLRQSLEPVIGKVINAIKSKYGQQGEMNLAYGMYAYADYCDAYSNILDINEARKMNGSMKSYLEGLGKTSGYSYRSCQSVVEQLQSGSVNQTVIAQNLEIIITTYME